MSTEPRGALTFGSLFSGSQTCTRLTRPTRPALARVLDRVRALVWPPACSQPHH
ncbi:hypothetical protein ACUN7V_20875 [Quadrisphaera oryzae]|uniref:hypothetical protein n=1 Tax=Quadrisphaera TaxID=317661 RepID=UPI001644F00A|nr:hypothetical protein [Quadrisphaera sp. RL12-1S]MBC3760070.1 hypothetical protein [Quadrisphaera sp. RL12-1S]